MARIPYFDLSKATGRAAHHFESKPRMKSMNLFRMLAHSGELVDGWTRLGVQVLEFTELDPILREIAIIRVGVISNAAYELHQHRRVARAIGMSDALIAAIETTPQNKAFDELQSLVMQFTDEAVHDVRVSDKTFAAIVERLGYKQTQELLIAICYYMMVSRFLETFGVDIEDWDIPPNESATKRRP